MNTMLKHLTSTGLLCMVALADAQGRALNPATAQISTSASGGYNSADNCSLFPCSSHTIGPVATPLFQVEAQTGDSNDPRLGAAGASYSAESIMNVSFGSGVPDVGGVSGEGQVATTGAYTVAEAFGSGLLNASFRIVQTGNAPFAPSMVPIDVAISGAAQVSGSGDLGSQLFVSAYVTGNSVLAPLESLDYSTGVGQTEFNKNVALSLYPSDGGYTVVVNALFDAVAAGGGENQTRIFVDPTVTFDQAAFDQLYGASAFPLAQYYGLEFSQNLPVPIPVTAWLVLSGLGGLSLVRRGRQGRRNRGFATTGRQTH